MPPSYWAFNWINQFAAEGITSGCGGTNYCPDQAATREQFAIFVERARGIWSVPAYTSYSYVDISASFFKNYIQYLVSGLGINDSCATGSNYFCPGDPLHRDHLAYLIVRVFGLPMAYEPPSLASAPEMNEKATTENIMADLAAMPPLPESVQNPEAKALKVQAMPALNTTSATFMYDGDGNRVAQTVNGVTTYFIGNYYEVTGQIITKYYYAGSQRVAMRQGSTLYYLLSDHLNSTSLTLDASGNVVSELRYTAWGVVRYQAGTAPTQYQFTGQYSYVGTFGLVYFNARWYDSSLGRFAQADSIVPGGVQGYDRYAYANNSPVVYNDPSGHMACDGPYGCYGEQRGSYSRPPKPLPPVVTPSTLPIAPTAPTPSCAPASYPKSHPCAATSIGPWVPPSSWDLDPSHPDYYTFTVNGELLTFSATVDRYNQVYIGLGGNVGKSILLPTFSLTGGWIGSLLDSDMPSQGNIETFLSGLTINAGGGYVGGGSVTVSPSTVDYVPELYGFERKLPDVAPVAMEGGAYIPPGAGVAVTWGFPLSPIVNRIRFWLKTGQ